MVDIPFGSVAKFALLGAYEVAREISNQEVRCEHLLIGLTRAAPALFVDEATAEKIESEIRDLIGRRPKIKPPRKKGTLIHDELVKRCLRDARTAAQKRSANAVDGGDLLNALIATADDEITGLLEARGISVARASGRQEGFEPSDDPLSLVQLSDDSSKPFYDQVAEQIKEAIAEGRLIPGDRIPPVRRLADALDLAPGTVARSYRQLEAAGVVETDGARGTFVAAPTSTASDNVSERIEVLAGLMRSTAVTAFHMGASERDLSEALKIAVRGVFTADEEVGAS